VYRFLDAETGAVLPINGGTSVFLGSDMPYFTLPAHVITKTTKEVEYGADEWICLHGFM
jgi:hypothetical protein